MHHELSSSVIVSICEVINRSNDKKTIFVLKRGTNIYQILFQLFYFNKFKMITRNFVKPNITKMAIFYNTIKLVSEVFNGGIKFLCNSITFYASKFLVHIMILPPAIWSSLAILPLARIYLRKGPHGQ